MLPHRVKDSIKGSLCRIIVIPYLRFTIRKTQNIHDMVELAYSFHERLPLPRKLQSIFLIAPAQVKEEITELLKITGELRPRTLLEIGTARGGTLFLFAGVADPEALIISIDLPEGLFGGGYPEWRIPLYKSFERGKQRIVLLRRDSHDPETLREVEGILAGRKLDFLFVDGDHSYEGVRRDFEMYSPLVRKGGIIAFHDIVPGPPGNVGGVPRFWSEVKKDYKHLEIVKDWRQGGYGIGVLFV